MSTPKNMAAPIIALAVAGIAVIVGIVVYKKSH